MSQRLCVEIQLLVPAYVVLPSCLAISYATVLDLNSLDPSSYNGHSRKIMIYGILARFQGSPGNER